VDFDVRQGERRETRSDQLKHAADCIVTLKASGDADGRHVGELEDAIFGKERDAAIDGRAEGSQAIEEFSDQFASGRHGRRVPSLR
jgi:hypothetical protein